MSGSGAFEFKFFVSLQLDSATLFLSAKVNKVNKVKLHKVKFRGFIVFISKIWPDSFPKCFIVTNFFNVQFFKVSFFWFSSTILSSNFFVFL